ncbi:MAG: arginine--tRNA ligase, partial [Mycoplasmataceae bacterium]|nr:arginine--tRNA ligase [Mycoplasmataceae bacterium]
MLHKNPEIIAQDLIAFLKQNYASFYSDIQFVKPGFINFYLKSKLNLVLLKKILDEKDAYPIYENNKKRINIEFVSANPTGKLHLAHAYAAIFGMSLVRVFNQLGFNIQKEYYINDAGNQITLLALSVFIRYLNFLNIKQE